MSERTEEEKEAQEELFRRVEALEELLRNPDPAPSFAQLAQDKRRVDEEIRKRSIQFSVEEGMPPPGVKGAQSCYRAWRTDRPEERGYGKTANEALRAAQVAALRGVADRLERNESGVPLKNAQVFLFIVG